MKISIITVCYNSAKTIEDTLKSVANQKDINVEHILIDGASKDGTQQIIKQYDSVTTLISEPDKGIYDAMNKGIALATGDVIGTLNADDFYSDDHVLEEVAKVFLDPTVEACYGDLVYVRQNHVGQVVRLWKSIAFKPGSFKLGWMPAHPTFFVRASVYNRLGAFDLNYKIAADFELLFRFIEQNKIKTVYLSKVLVKMRLGGTTNKNMANVATQNREIISILRRYYPDFSVIRFVVSKALNRTAQFYYGYKFRFFGQ
jgi:glycosyltransferase involved in cell wall biosynthesis